MELSEITDKPGSKIRQSESLRPTLTTRHQLSQIVDGPAPAATHRAANGLTAAAVQSGVCVQRAFVQIPFLSHTRPAGTSWFDRHTAIGGRIFCDPMPDEWRCRGSAQTVSQAAASIATVSSDS